VRNDLERFFTPRSIAVIGASQEVETISGQPLKHLQSHGYRGRLYPVNPRYREVGGLPCYPSLTAVPDTPDLALVLVNATRVPDILRECGRKGVPYVVIFSSGFSEVGGAGIALQEELVRIAREFDIGVVGPNCQGMINIADRVYAGFGSIFNSDYEPGAVSMVSQSGGFGYSVMNLSSKEGGLSFRQMITTGNEIGVSTLDFIDYFVRDPDTHVIAAYVEGLRDARRLIEVGEKALSAGKPILMWKVGNTEHGQRAAASHTANLGGSMALYRAAFRQTGIIRIEDIQDLVDYGRAFRSGRLPEGNRLAIITVSGGAGILMTDECIAGGVMLAKLEASTLEKLRAFVPSFGSLLNPIDVTAAIFNDTTLMNRALQALVDDPNVDSIALISASLQGDLARDIAREVVAVAERTSKTIVLCWSARDELAKEAYALLDGARLPHYKSPVRCARVLVALTSYAQARRRHAARREDAPPLTLERSHAKGIVSSATAAALTEFDSKRVLAEYGIPVTREALARSVDEAQAAGDEIGYPVALKVQSSDIAHKTEAKGVRLGIRDGAELKAGYEEVLANARAHSPGPTIAGVLVQEMVAGGVEVILGVTNDASFGPAILLGLGGIFAEVLHDVTFRHAPVTAASAREMIEEIRGYALLNGARGRPPADVDALADAIVRLSALAIDLQESLAELDVNPLFVRERGRGVIAADALIKPIRSDSAYGSKTIRAEER
jgi:acyl-CoA synthetase (NDP forming)